MSEDAQEFDLDTLIATAKSKALESQESLSNDLLESSEEESEEEELEFVNLAKSKGKQDGKAKQWFATIQNITSVEGIPKWKKFFAKFKWAVIGFEKAKREHAHIFFWLDDEQRFGALKQKYPFLCKLQKVRKPYDCYKYCIKDGNFRIIGDEKLTPKEKKEKRKRDQDEAFGLAMREPTVQRGLEVIREMAPRDYCLHSEAIERSLKKCKSKQYEHAYPVDSFVPLMDLEDKAVLLWGPTNLGKSHYAAAHFERPLVVSHVDGLKRLSPDHDGIVFNDMSFKHWPPESVIHLLEFNMEAEVHARYINVIIPKGMKKIFTYNSNNCFYDLSMINAAQREAIERRFIRVNVTESLIK